MKMSDNLTEYEVLIEQYLRSILDISEDQAPHRHIWRLHDHFTCTYMT